MDIGIPVAAMRFDASPSRAPAMPHVSTQSESQRFVPSGKRIPPRPSLKTSSYAPRFHHLA